MDVDLEIDSEDILFTWPEATGRAWNIIFDRELQNLHETTFQKPPFFNTSLTRYKQTTLG